MMRIKIVVKGNYLATYEMPVRITDINYGNHTGNDALAGMLQEARMQWLSQYGHTELNIEGTGLIMSDLALEFKNETFYKDLLLVEMYAEVITAKSFDLYYVISTERNGNKIMVAKAKTGMVCFNYSEKKVKDIPEVLFRLIKKS